MLKKTGEMFGLWAYLTVVGGGVPDRDVLMAGIDSVLRPPDATHEEESRDRPPGWAVVPAPSSGVARDDAEPGLPLAS